MKFENIQEANNTIVKIDVKGKPYSEVNQRIKAFRQLQPNGRISTQILKMEDGVVTMKACVYDESGFLLGTGHAQEKENSTFINKTSYIENAETSCVGRALGMCGIGIDTSVASAEEVLNAINNQNKDNELDLIEEFNHLLIETETDLDELKKYYKVKLTTDLTNTQLEDAIKKMAVKRQKKEIF